MLRKLLVTAAFTALVFSAGAQSAPDVMNVQWLKKYDNSRSDALGIDPRFQALLADSYSGFPPTFWHGKSPVETYLDFFRVPGPVFIEHHRWLLASGTMTKALNDDGGMLWIDTHTDADQPQPWIVFCAFEANRHKLYLFSSHNPLQGEELEHDLRLNVGRWLAGWNKRTGYVDHVYLVTPAGKRELQPVEASVALNRFSGQ
jgi:hypothetical protein